MSDFDDKYTTAEKKAADPKETSKTEISNDFFAIGELLNAILLKLEDVRKSVRWQKL